MEGMVEPSKRIVLEDTPEAFWEQFAGLATPVTLYPQPLFSPLIEVQSPIGVLYAFDRGLSPLPPGAIQLLFHAQLESWQPAEGQGRLSHTGSGCYEAVGQVKQALGGPFYLLEIARDANNALPILVAASGLETGQIIQAQLRPPLMVFRSEGQRN